MISKADTTKLMQISDKISDIFQAYSDYVLSPDEIDQIEAQVKIAYELGKASK